ncbi:MAG: amine oxidase [Gammaproteobacteria bacterium]
MTDVSRTLSPDDFERFAADTIKAVKRQYDRNVNKDLSQQQSHELFKRNVVKAWQQAYRDTLALLRQSELRTETSGENEIKVWTDAVSRAFDGFTDDMMSYAVQKHRTSCALSNFPEEHKPSREYIAEVIELAAADYRDFAAQASDVITGKSLGYHVE